MGDTWLMYVRTRAGANDFFLFPLTENNVPPRSAVSSINIKFVYCFD